MEELEAVDWYKQRSDDCEDAALKDILLHNMREEMEHACMVFEWLRRSDPEWAEQIATYMFTDAPITEVEENETGGTSTRDDGESEAKETPPSAGRASPPSGFTVGPLKDHGE